MRKFKVEDRVPFDVIVKWASASNASSGKWDPEDSGQVVLPAFSVTLSLSLRHLISISIHPVFVVDTPLGR